MTTTEMTPESFRLFDFLNCCQVAVTDGAAGRHAAAAAAWLEAWTVMDLLDSDAAGIIHTAANPARPGGKATLANALNAAVTAVLYVMDGRGDAAVRRRDALAAAAALPAQLRDALTDLLDAAGCEVAA